jgi:hypothetical protein
MDPLVATLFLVLLALLGARLSFSTESVPAGPRLLFRTGTHFLFVGFLLGPPVLALVSRDAISQLFPLLGLALGWVGMLFGLQLDRSALARFPRSFVWVAMGQAVVTFAVVLAAGAALAGYLDLTSRPVLLLLTVVAAIGSVSTPAGIAMVSSNFRARGQVRELLFFIAALDGVVGVVALDVGYSAFHDLTRGSAVPAAGWFWALSSVALAVVCSVVFLWLGRLRPTREELVLYLLGISALSAGAALQLQLSPLFVGVMLGGIVINLSPDGDRIFDVMGKWEQPIYVVMLLLAGALLRFPTWWVVPAALVYTLARIVGKAGGTFVMVKLAGLPSDVPRRLGLGLISQGGISLAMVLSAVLTLGPANLMLGDFLAVDLLFSTVVIGVVLSELVGPILTTSVLARAGELGAARTRADHPPGAPPTPGSSSGAGAIGRSVR